MVEQRHSYDSSRFYRNLCLYTTFRHSSTSEWSFTLQHRTGLYNVSVSTSTFHVQLYSRRCSSTSCVDGNRKFEWLCRLRSFRERRNLFCRNPLARCSGDHRLFPPTLNFPGISSERSWNLENFPGKFGRETHLEIQARIFWRFGRLLNMCTTVCPSKFTALISALFSTSHTTRAICPSIAACTCQIVRLQRCRGPPA